ncbi:hypothetical protein [Nostoc sp.]|uniref:hypothetical protein n=1 Tax=Nostoc sp. TaxID=1180 RepID=UPI002FF7DF2F
MVSITSCGVGILPAQIMQFQYGTAYHFQIVESDCPQNCSVKTRDAMNRRLYKRLIVVETAIYRVFLMIYHIFAIAL